MVSEAPISKGNYTNTVTKKSSGRSSPSKTNTPKVPKRVHKAERERLKRDHMNELFLELGKTLEPTRQDKGKNSTLNECIRLLHDLLAQVDSLKKENAALLSESHYVSMERDELQEENSTLEAQIGKLQGEMEGRLHSQPLWGLDPSQPQVSNGEIMQQLEDHIMLPVIDHATQAAPIVGPIFVMPLHDNPLHPKPDAADTVVPKLPPKVSRPHARYPSPSDSWPSHILSEQPKVANHTT